MKTRALFTFNAVVLVMLVFNHSARAQEPEVPGFEIGVQYSSLSIALPGFGGTETAVGGGGRVTYNFNNYFAVEAEGNLSPSGIRSDYVTGGASQQLQVGAKVGKRWRRFGLFAKARPGLVTFGDTLTPLPVVSGNVTSITFNRERKTHFSMDLGGVLEVYPSRRTLVRFDAGDTIIRYGEHREVLPGFNNPTLIGPVGPQTKHNFQFTAGVGFRFGGVEEDAAPQSAQSSGERVRRFEVGIQFSSLALRPPASAFSRFGDTGSAAEAGGGLRFGFNATDNLAFEVEGNFYPRRSVNGSTATGGYPAQLQAGAKYGRRFRHFGIFAKARPGIVTFSSVSEITNYEAFAFAGETFFFPNFRRRLRSYFSMDMGGVLEFYPTRRLFTRLDVGDTMIRYPARDNPSIFTSTLPLPFPSEWRHNLQVTTGLGFRF